MAPRAKAAAATQARAEDSEDDLAAATIPSEHPKTKRPASKMAKAKSATRRISAVKPAAKRKAAPRQPRQPLKDRTNVPDGNETEEVDAFDDEDSKPKPKRAKTTAGCKNSTTSTKSGRAAKRVPSAEPLVTIPETQPDIDMMDVEQSIEIDPDSMETTRVPSPKRQQRAPAASVQPLQPRPSARTGSAQPVYSRARDRSGSASGTDRRGGDPELRRLLNEMTKKYDNLHLKYESLEEIGKKDGETNFEKLKRASDQKAKDANELIASLKKELSDVRKSTTSASSETAGLQKQINTLTAANEKLTAESVEMKDKFQVSQNELKSIEAKLMAARQQISNGALEAKAHEAASKKASISTTLGSVDAQKQAKMKENLYADLTGLIVCGVKRKEGEDEYDCIQTGRNGTLHFHLSIANDSSTPHPKTPSGLNYEDAEFAYEPLLDDSRDRELLELLPDYLTEEICFPRNHAQRFYSKVVDSMTKRIVVEED